MRISGCLTAFAVGAAALSLPILVAFESGADAGRSGGPAGYESGESGNCLECHAFNPSNIGSGRVELLGAPRRYRADTLYDLTVRISDPDQRGAGFEISAEGGRDHIGVFQLTDPLHTAQSGFGESIVYVTHNQDGYDDSLDRWSINGGWYEYDLGWEAPAEDSGPVTLFVAGNAVNDSQGTNGDHFYSTYASLQYAHPGDGDGDRDVDFRDFALVQRCFNDMFPATGEDCEYVDFDGDGAVSLFDVDDFVSAYTGPTATLPAGFVLADPVRGGQLYDKWWVVNGAIAPTGDHPLWAFRPDMGSNTRTGPDTWRCKECHGWDYKGVDGAYGSGSHRTGFGGVFNTTLTPQELFDLLEADAPETGGHDMDSAGMSDRDLWDVVKMTVDSTIDTDIYIAPNATFVGNEFSGGFWYGTACSSCHGNNGTDINLGTEANPAYVGTIAVQNPWEFFHKIRFGQPGAEMPSLDLLGWSLQRAADIGAKAATLPQ